MNKPEKKIKAGAISATIWKNEKQDGEGKPFNYFSVSIDRNYTDKEGSWHNTNSLRISDLPKAILVLQKAHEELVLKQQEAEA